MGKILIIEDSNLVRLEIRNALEKGGFSEIKELNSADSVSRMPELYLNDVILIILDIELPGISGIALASQLKLHPTYSNIPVIFISGNNYYKVVNEAINAGGVDYIVKPFNPEVLVQRIKNTIVNFRGVKKVNEENDYKKMVNTIINGCERATIECMDLDFLVFNTVNNDKDDMKNLIEKSIEEIESVSTWKDRVIVVLPFESEKHRSIKINKIKEKMLQNNKKLEFSKAVTFKFSEENDLDYLKKELLE